MTSPRRTAALSLAAAAAALAAVLPVAAGAAPTGSLSGFLSDADTGLPLAAGTMTWNGTTSPAPQATTDTSGRYLFSRLAAAPGAPRHAAGPAGWDRTDVGPVDVPATGRGAQNVALHRDW